MTLRLRFALLACGLSVALLGGLGLVMHAVWERWVVELQRGMLEDRARVIAGVLEIKSDGRLDIEGEEDPFTRDPAHPFRVETVGGRLLYASPFDWPPLDPLGDARARFVETRDEAGVPHLVLTRRVMPHHGGEVVLHVAASRAPFLALERRLIEGLWLAIAVALVSGVAASALLARLFVRPVDRLVGTIARIEARSLDERLPEKGLAPELRPLAGAFNALLSRLAAAFRRERDFVARASHALRTPAATMLSVAEVALRRERSPEAYRKALEDIAEQARQTGRLADELLALSRLDERGALPAERVELQQVVADVLRLFDSSARAKGLALESDVPAEIALKADPAALREALASLVDNAVRYSPGPGCVGVRARQDGALVTVEVWDTGPGIADDEKAHVFERFRRGRSAGADQSGSGLGLAIVRAVAEAQGASVHLVDRPGGGLVTVLRWPAA